MRFDENAHRRVIRELQRDRGVQLRKIGPARSYLVDDRGIRYVVVGGADYRHGISRSIFEAEEGASDDTLLVVATLDGSNLDIFTGPFRPLLEHKDRLTADKDHYIIHLHRFPTGLLVREVPSLELQQTGRQSSGDRERASRPTPERIRRLQAIAAAKARKAKPAKEVTPRSGKGVVAVEGKLIRVDFRGRGTK